MMACPVCHGTGFASRVMLTSFPPKPGPAEPCNMCRPNKADQILALTDRSQDEGKLVPLSAVLVFSGDAAGWDDDDDTLQPGDGCDIISCGPVRFNGGPLERSAWWDRR